jgi:hypothetical protein
MPQLNQPKVVFCSMKKLFSLRKLTEGIVFAVANYPLVIVCAALLGAEFIYLLELEDSKLFDRWMPMLFVEGLGISLFFALHTFSIHKRLSVLKTVILLLVGAIVLVVIGLHIDRLSMQAKEGVLALELLTYGIMMHLLVAFLPFFGKQQSNGFWQYNKSLFIRALTTVLYTVVLYAGLSGAILAITELFDVEFNKKIYVYLWIFMAFPVSALIMTAGVPDPKYIDTLEQSEDLPGGLRLFVQFVLLPLVAIYLLILYAYAGKILIEWSLPQGWVTILIMVFSVVGMLAMLLVHPFQQLAEHAWIKVITKNYYRSLLPLLVLQYVAIFTRISEYGFTSPRWAVVAITLWLTYICIYKVFFKGNNIILIPFTLCVVAVLFLIGPFSHNSISVWSQTAKINRLVKELGMRNNMGKLTKYQPNAGTDSLMNELYEATRYLSRNHSTTGLEPEIHYPTDEEVRKKMRAEAIIDVKLYGDSTDPKWSNPAKVDFDRYDYRSALRNILNDQYDSFGINVREFARYEDPDVPYEIYFVSQTPQIFIPKGPWTKIFSINEADYLNWENYANISDYVDLIKIQQSKKNHYGLVMLINGTEFQVDLSPMFKKYGQTQNEEFNKIKVPNELLSIPLNKGNIHGWLMIDKVGFREIKKLNNNHFSGELRTIDGKIYLQ